MPLDWVAAGAAVISAGKAYMDHLAEQAEAGGREQDRITILNAIHDLGAHLDAALVTELSGALNGFADTYNSYDPDPADPHEEGRLVEIIDESNLFIGRMDVMTSHVNIADERNLAFEVFPIYVSMIYLRAQAMTERQITYGAVEANDALPTMVTAISRLNGLLADLRGRSNSRFGDVTCRPISDSEDPGVCWYRFGNGQVICGSTRDPEGIAKCQRSRAAHMEGAYPGFPGVAQITAVVDQLEAARDALGTVRIDSDSARPELQGSNSAEGKDIVGAQKSP